MDTNIVSADLQRLFGVNRTALNDLAKRGIVQRGGRKGSYRSSRPSRATASTYVSRPPVGAARLART